MLLWIPANVIGRIYAVSIHVSHKCLVSKTDILSKRVVSIRQAITLYFITFQNLFDIFAHFKPVIFWVLNCNIKTKLTRKGTLLEFLIIFDQVESYLSSWLRILRLFKIDRFDSSSALHFDEKSNNQIPSFSEVLVLNWNMKFPIRYFVTKLILSMPVHSTKPTVHFDEAIIAKSFILLVLFNLVSIDFKILIGEVLRNDKIIFFWPFLLDFLSSCIDLRLLHRFIYHIKSSVLHKHEHH